MPISTFGVNVGTPCLDSVSQVSSVFYELELNKVEFQCPLETVTGKRLDTRYQVFDTSAAENRSEDGYFSLKEWDVMEENNVA